MLNDQEKTQLEQIERGFVAQDPDFAARIAAAQPIGTTRHGATPRAMRSMIVIGYTFGIALAIGGIAQTSVGLLVGGVVVLVAVGLFHADRSEPDEHP